MKKQFRIAKLAVLLLLLCNPIVNAQWQNDIWIGKQTNNWCISFNGVSFTTGEPELFSGVNFNVLEGSATISNTDGSLLFYAGDMQIRNSNHQLMLNGGDLIAGGSSSTQSGVIIPKPGSSTIYYLFNVDNAVTPAPGLVYSEIDMTLDNGLGGVTATKNIVLNANAKSEKITAVHHQDGIRYWVITHLVGSNNFVAYLVSADGVSTTPVVSSVGNFYPDAPDPNDINIGPEGVGQLKASPDGTKLASVMIDGPTKGLELFDFNNATGEISNAKYIDGFTQMTYGVEFSPNSKLVYVTNSMGLVLAGTIHQFDATLTTVQEIKNSEVIIADIPFNGTVGSSAMQLAPNGRIYIADVINGAMNAIPFPNNSGMTAGFEPLAVDPQIGGGIGLPSFTQSFLGSGILSEETCPGTVQFSLLRIPGVTSIAWNFGDAASGAANTSSIAEHTFSAAGTYTVTATITSNGGTQTASTQITVSAPSGINAPNDITQCANNSNIATFNLVEQTPSILGTSNPTDFSVEYYASQADADNGNNSITTSTATVGTPRTIYVKVTTLASGCSSILTFDIVAIAPPVIAPISGLELCDGDSINGFETFDLTQQTAAILNGQPGTVTYFLTQADADANVNAIQTPENFTSTSNPQTIYVRAGANCFQTASFIVSVTPSNLFSSDLTLSGCSPIDLTQVSELVGNNINLTYYLTETDANSASNPISNADRYSLNNPETNLFVRAENTDGCADVAILTVTRDTCEIQKGISANGDNLNDYFNLESYDVAKLQIFNRYGVKVYSRSNYTNQFIGESDKGDQLPDGTYYYVINFNNADSKTGWIYINRKN